MYVRGPIQEISLSSQTLYTDQVQGSTTTPHKRMTGNDPPSPRAAQVQEIRWEVPSDSCFVDVTGTNRSGLPERYVSCRVATETLGMLDETRSKFEHGHDVREYYHLVGMFPSFVLRSSAPPVSRIFFGRGHLHAYHTTRPFDTLLSHGRPPPSSKFWRTKCHAPIKSP